MPTFDPDVPFRAVLPDGEEYQRARVVRVVDGDTVRVQLDLGHDVTLTASLRIATLQAPERFRGTPEARAGGDAAWEAARTLLIEDDTVYVRTEKTASGAERETFGRLVAHVWYRAMDQAWYDFADVMTSLGWHQP